MEASPVGPADVYPGEVIKVEDGPFTIFINPCTPGNVSLLLSAEGTGLAQGECGTFVPAALSEMFFLFHSPGRIL